jgi:hypothetical protein
MNLEERRLANPKVSHDARIRGQRRVVILRVVSPTIALVIIALLSAFEFLPVAFAQTPVYDVQVPRAVNPVTLDGEIGPNEYVDAANYSLACYDVVVAWGFEAGNATCSTKSRLYMKYDVRWTYFGFDNPEGTSVYDSFHYVGANLSFDIEDSKAKDHTLRLNLEFESNTDTQPHETSDPYCCTPMFQVYSRGKEYNWRFHFGPSSLTSQPHAQFEIQVSTKLLASYSPPRISFSFCCAGSTKGLLGFPNAGSSFATLQLSGAMTYRLTVNATSGSVPISIDGKKYPSAQASLLVNSTGDHVVSVPKYVTLDPNIRLYFVRWSDGSSLPERTVTLTQNVTLEARYGTLYKLTLNNDFGNTTGGGWYSPGSEVGFSILDSTSQSKAQFGGWYENGTLVTNSLNSTIVMDRPHNLTAMWRHAEIAKNISAYLVALSLVAGFGVIITIVIHKRKAATLSTTNILAPSTSPQD